MNAHDSLRVAIVGDYEGVFEESWEVRNLLERVAEVRAWNEPAPIEPLPSFLEKCHAIIAIRERMPFPGHVLERLPSLELISQSGTHANHIDLEVATRLGILVASGRGSPDGTKRPSTMAELTFGMLFALTREICTLNTQMAAGEWPSSVGRSIRGLTMGILGMGRHGVPLARLAQAFGMRTVAWGPTLTPERAAEDDTQFLELDDVLRQSDVVSINLRLSDLTRGLIDKRRIGLMKPNAILINTARGEIIDEDALTSALSSGRLGGACLDVFTTEPLLVESPLRELPNVILTPHVGWTVDRHLQEFVEDTTLHLEHYLDGQLPVEALLNPASADVDRGRHGGVTGGR